MNIDRGDNVLLGGGAVDPSHCHCSFICIKLGKFSLTKGNFPGLILYLSLYIQERNETDK